ncbi:hypothetical protein FRIGORI9N_420126 [Frigoribacterium sp. 9N]|nr:hypothetical protein FRIGORI9N_420126 [Frigoribacterium sp. 9N]
MQATPVRSCRCSRWDCPCSCSFRWGPEQTQKKDLSIPATCLWRRIDRSFRYICFVQLWVRS